MENKDLPSETVESEATASPEKSSEPTNEVIEEESEKPDATESNEDKPTQNGETEAETPEISEESDKNPKPIIDENLSESNDKPGTPGRTTRGTKRKATESEKNDISSENVESETVEQKENVDSKNDDNVQKEDDEEDSSMKSIPETQPHIMGKGKRARIPNKRYSDILLSPNRKSTGHSKSGSMTDYSDEITIKEEPMDSSSVSSVVSSPSLPVKKQRASAPKENLQDPRYLKPFKFGWKRELVWRSTSTSTKPAGDIYYYTPDGKKVRSFREVSDLLTGKNLTIDNFTFTKEPIGIDDPEKEVTRHAKIMKSDGAAESPFAKKLIRKQQPNKVEVTPAKKTVKPPAPKQPTPPSVTKEPVKMPQKKGKSTPVAKKPKLASKPEEPPAPAKVATPPPRSTRSSLGKSTRAPQNSVGPPIQKKRNLKLKSITNASSITPEEKNEAKFMENYLQNLSFGYNTLLYVFQYLKIQDLLRAGCVCTMWRDIASHPILWRTVRMKNSQVHSFEGLANTLKQRGTTHLDLRKMLLPSNGDEIWPEFSEAIARVNTLKKIELCRCPASVVEQLATSNPTLEIINAVTIKCESINLDPLKALNKIKELRLKSTSGLTINSIDSLKELKTLKILSLTSVSDLHKLNLSVIAELTNLQSLDLGECTDFPKTFGQDILAKLEKLEKLRLEKGQGSCHTFEILEAVKDMKKLEQLELVNFDVKAGFDKALGVCTNIRKLMIIPTYISQSATTNNMVLAGVLRLHRSLTHFVWGVTLELLRVTELFVDQCEDSNKKEKRPTGNGDSIPVLKPVPDLSHGGDILAASNPPQVEILPLPNLQKLLLNSLPTTRVKILKIPFHATWRQTLTDSV